MCALCTEDWVDDERKARLEAEALRLGPMLEKWAMEAEFKVRLEAEKDRLRSVVAAIS